MAIESTYTLNGTTYNLQDFLSAAGSNNVDVWPQSMIDGYTTEASESVTSDTPDPAGFVSSDNPWGDYWSAVTQACASLLPLGDPDRATREGAIGASVCIHNAALFAWLYSPGSPHNA